MRSGACSRSIDREHLRCRRRWISIVSFRQLRRSQFQYLLQDLFERNTFWELETERATAQQTEGGTWQVTLDVRARKVVVDEAGVETEVPMDDWLEVGVFNEGEPYLEKLRIRSGTQTITVTVPQKPARAGIDPRHLLSDLEEVDKNVTTIRLEE